MNIVGASCPCNRRIKNIIKDSVEYINVVGASCLDNMGNKYILRDSVDYINVAGASCFCIKRIKNIIKIL